ncbi:nitroreductase [Thauera linaloolentis]|uniref:Nitroreductase n=1 Tax=Thauera linaloolentis (strain DSM 12138 / JCM 21573 / CCUG 41526 / CIP 105981 / IAM 15112 / NBRC 102519 / 47Lol) TaxID=1123367 RepID=N6Z0J7_THAL4|nr:nitroreductase [Thauera linaloolentis]ENO87898.1 nitroreductase [Thauera linaloolentis 47Lol = DSM 12138]MCM8567568.1 nitroreductase [Thauera linaloolentis]
MTASVQSVVDEAIQGRYSCRAFLPQPVPRALVADILAVASRAPSGTNIQPWKAWVVTGASKARLTERLLAAFDDPDEAATHTEPYAYYPREWVPPYVDRRRRVGQQLYGLLGIQKGDAQRMHEQFARNYKFFDAPVGMIFSVSRLMEQGSWLDYGMLLQNVMLAAKARGLDTCPQVAPIQFHRIIHEELGIPDSETLVCGMSLGHADPDAPENRLRTERAAVDEWVVFRD